MGPDWKRFVDELIKFFEKNPDIKWSGDTIVKIIKNEQIRFLEKALKIMDGYEGVPL